MSVMQMVRPLSSSAAQWRRPYAGLVNSMDHIKGHDMHQGEEVK